MASGIPGLGKYVPWFPAWKEWVEANIGGGGGGVSDGDKGDIVVSGGGTVWTLDAAITAATLGGVLATRSINTTAPLTGGGNLSADRTLAVNTFGAAQAGVVPLSGGGTTNFLRADGTWAAPPSGGGGGSATTIEVALGAPSWQGKFTITDAAISGTSKVLCWQAPGPYTGKGTRADEAELQPVTVIAVEPGAGSAVVKWQTPPVFAIEPLVASGRPSVIVVAASIFGPTHPQQTVRRIHRAGGNVKFSYMVL